MVVDGKGKIFEDRRKKDVKYDQKKDRRKASKDTESKKKK